MSLETYELSSLDLLSHPDPKIISLMKGKEVWEGMNLSSEKDYLLAVFEKDSKCHVICINRKAFIQNVKENISLFRYALGPVLTPESLLTELMYFKNKFFDVLGNNQVLIEILLGNGRQNALVHSRLKVISELEGLGKTDEFPLVSKKFCKSWAASSERYKQQPSFGFSSVADEEMTLKQLTVDSGKLKPFNGYEIPRFQCEPDSEETKSILSSYEQNRGKIVKAVASKTFLEDSLRKFFAENGQIVESPQIPKDSGFALPVNREEIAQKIVQIVQKRIAMEPVAAKKFQASFMQGVAAREKGKRMPAEIKRTADTQTTLKELMACKSLEQANAYFAKLSTKEQFVSLVPNEILYKTVKAGKGNAVSSRTKSVSFQYSFQILGDQHVKDYGIVKQESLSALIPGVARALLGMQQGEERVVYIHPKQAYGEETYFSPNISIVAQIRLFEFEEGDREVSVMPAHDLEVRDYRDLLARYEVLRGEEYFEQGVEFWDSIKKSGDFIDFQIFQKAYTSYSDIQANTLTVEQENKFAIEFESLLQSLQRKD